MHRNVPDSDSEDELPAGWEERATSDGNVYFINHLTKGTQWTHPRTGRKKVVPLDLPFGWIKEVDEESGKTVYTEGETGRRSVIDPRLAFASEEKLSTNDFRQRFDASTTALQVLHGRDLSGKYAIITGGNAGIGYETSRSLARHGCRVLMACRNLDFAQNAINKITEEHRLSEKLMESAHLNLSSLKSVQEFAVKILDSKKKVDIMILNAGVFGLPYTETEDGYESTFQINHLSHLYLALLLEPALSAGSRVIFVSSESHRFADLSNTFTEETLSFSRESYNDMLAYNNSKLYNVLGANYLAALWKHKKIAVNSLHPGNMVYTNLCNNWWLYKIAFFLVRPFTKSLQQAASTTVYCAAALELEGVTGLYFNNCFRCDESCLAKDADIATNVFSLCLKMIEKTVGSSGLENYKSLVTIFEMKSNQ